MWFGQQKTPPAEGIPVATATTPVLAKAIVAARNRSRSPGKNELHQVQSLTQPPVQYSVSDWWRWTLPCIQWTLLVKKVQFARSKRFEGIPNVVLRIEVHIF